MLLYLLPVFAYLVGSLSTAVIVCGILGLPDPRSAGSNNPGATNVLRIGGKKAAALTLFGDVLKGVIPVVVARTLTDDPGIIALTGAAAFLGHLFPVFFGFRGGKGVATAAGGFIAISPQLTGILMAVWLVTALLSRYSSLAALTATLAAVPLTAWLLPGWQYLAMAVLIAVLLFIRHKANIQRLLAGEESRIRLRRS